MADTEFERFLRSEFITCLKLAFTESLSEADWKFKEGKELTHSKFPKIILLTISSHKFRIIFTLHFDYSENCLNFVAQGLKSGNEKLGKDRINDYLSEVGNSFCGAIKRNLGNIIPSLGMSTPNMLDDFCLEYIKELEVLDQHTATVSFNGQETFGASYFLCASESLNIDMSNAHQSTASQADAGELEFF